MDTLDANSPCLKGLVVGFGSPHGDDRLGWQVVELLKRIELPGFRVEAAAAPIDLLNLLVSVDQLHLIDACRGNGPLGSVHKLDWPDEQLLTFSWNNSHEMSLPSTLELAQILGLLPKRVVVWAVEVDAIEHWAQGGPLLAQWTQHLATQMAKELN